MIEYLAAAYLGVHLAAQVVMERLGTRARRISERAGRTPTPLRDAPPVTVITPVYGCDGSTEASLRSRMDQRYPGAVQHVFALQDEADPARALLERLRAEYEFDLVVRPVRPGFTGKGSNLLHGVEAARHDLLLFCDDDVILPSDTLARIVAQLEDGRDVVACLPCYRRPAGVPARIYTLYWNMAVHFAWAAVTGLGVVRGLWGCALGLRRETLRKMGGMEDLGTHLAEDLEMGRRAHRLGLRATLGPPVDIPVGAMTWGQTWHKLNLFALVGIRQNPWGRARNALFFLLVYAYLPALVPAALSGPAGAAAAIAFLMGRGLVLGRLGVLSGGSFRFAWEFPLMDLLHAASLVRVSARGEARWGPMLHRVGPGGRLRPEG